MTASFDNLPVDPETEVHKSKRVQVEGYTALHQRWGWQGISGESLIFARDDVAGLSNARLKQMVEVSAFVKGQGPVMLQHTSAGYIFVNFNYGP